MKKLFLFLLLVPTICAQIDFTTTFPKIGFGDFYLFRNNGGTHWVDSNYYYSYQNELGYNYLWGQAYPATLSNSYNLKILHDLSIDHAEADNFKFVYHYCWSGVNDPGWLSYEVGGSHVARIDNIEADRFGFGIPGQTSWWAQDDWDYTMTGDRNFHDLIGGGYYVFYAGKNVHTPGVLLFGQINPYHTWVGGAVNDTQYTYTLEITARIDNDYVSQTDTIAVITIWEDPPPSSTSESGSLIDRTILSERQYIIPNIPTSPKIFILKPSYFTGTSYQGIKIPDIRKVNGSSSQLKFTVDWKNKCSLYIDKYSIYDQYYYNLFLADQTTIDNTKGKIQDSLRLIPGFNSQNPNFGHLYIDEPASMYYRSIEQVSNYSKLASGNKYYINGALGNVSDWDSHLNNFQRPYIPYVMSDIYPFLETLPNTQDALDYLIESSESGAAGTSKRGLRTMINYANNFTPNDPSDDHPFLQTLQVMTEMWHNSGGWYWQYRAPSYNEIIAEGWLALCYGAKGFMYYSTWSGGDEINTRTLGLLEPQGFSGNWPIDPAIPLVRNNRFYAVKELNRQVDQVSSEILKLTWVNGASLHKEGIPSEGSYITSTFSYTTDPDEPDPDNYVELGLFKKTTAYTDPNLEYFMVVNRLCSPNDPPTKYIITTLSKPNSPYLNWGLNEVGTANRWTGIKGCGINLEYAMGTGKLFKFAPVVLYGGDIRYNETISSTNTLSGEMSIKSGDTLTIAANSTYNINNNISIESGGTLILNPGATLNITNGASLVVNGNLVIKNNAVLNIPNGDSITVYGHMICETNLTIPSGRILKVQPGATLRFAYGDSLKVNGVLNAVGTSTSPITFTSSNGNTADSWGTITFNGSGASGSNINYASINYGEGIQCLDGANVTIQNSNIDTCTNGIYIYNASPRIIHNTIYNPAENGIWCQSVASYYNTIAIYGNTIIKLNNNINYHHFQGIWIVSSLYPDISQNIVAGFDYGMYIGGGSYAYFQNDESSSPYPNNLLTYNVRGLTAAWGTTVYAGSDWDMVGMYNSIYSNTSLDSWCHDESYIEAGYNWWGGGGTGNFCMDSTSYIAELEDYLSTDPWEGENKTIVKPINNLEAANHLNKSMGTTSSSSINLSEGILLEKQGRINDAMNFYKSLITNDQYVRIALSHLVNIKYKYARTEIVDYFGSLLTGNSQHYPKVEKILADISLHNNQFDNAMVAYDNVIQNDPAGYDGISARFEKLFAYLHIKNDPVKASQILSEIIGIESQNAEVQMLIKSVGNLISNNKQLVKNGTLEVKNIPTTYELYPNYPNPFNPSTTIRYQIPKPGVVTLKVYDILGREVTTLVNENKIEGFYQVTFNASMFASGVYIYQLRVNNFVSSKKMVVVK